MSDAPTRTLKAGVTYFALVFGAGFVLGAIRVPFLAPRLGERTAELVEMPFMLIVVVLSARFVVRHFDLPAGALPRLGAGFIALALLVAVEVVLAVSLQHRTLAEYVAGRDPVSGSVYLAMLALFAVMPLVVARVASTSNVRDRPFISPDLRDKPRSPVDSDGNPHDHHA